MFRTPRVTSIETLLICYKKEILALPEKNALTHESLSFPFGMFRKRLK